jgi:hypothetical protein
MVWYSMVWYGKVLYGEVWFVLMIGVEYHHSKKYFWHSIRLFLAQEGSCDFKTDFCGWTNDPDENNAQWIRALQDLETYNYSIISGQ